jgi:hypothetical protein
VHLTSETEELTESYRKKVLTARVGKITPNYSQLLANELNASTRNASESAIWGTTIGDKSTLFVTMYGKVRREEDL